MTAKPHDLSAVLNRLMEERRMTVKKAATVAGVSPSKIQSWRSGSKPTDFNAVRRLANALGVSFSFLLLGEDETRPRGRVSIAEVLDDGGIVFDGICEVTIRRLHPRRGKDD